MKIDTVRNIDCTSRREPRLAATGSGPKSSAAVLPAGTTDFDVAKRCDFTSMTRQEMLDWMIERIRAGEMSVEASLPFRAMTMKVSVETGQSVCMATDSTRINFVEKASQGIECAIANRDPEMEERFKLALEIMLGKQGQATAVGRRA